MSRKLHLLYDALSETLWLAVTRFAWLTCAYFLSLASIVSPETRERYTQVIDFILAQSDLTTISEKRIRRGLQDAVGYDLTPHKVCWWSFASSYSPG